MLCMKRRKVQRGVPEGVRPDFAESDRQERLSLLLADAIEALEDVAAGRVLIDEEVHRMLSVALAMPLRRP